ncbi:MULTISPECIES: apolipoprotein N-acyltransferase [Prauserella]|uniref:Apolipoprotein N-acyltransferase n=1 Tax=Prauserella flavalba TaxID=1477506 RepID=A0A318L9W8_9PSEU|nr:MULTISPECIES: apolipoprotein N-acyltransferase [Prauserella]PXY16793.1 apolipoprotein N-acyltransferase [Prauserella coralliicola]PXY17503.1 apolipoprotein N-acyltransferase [Prauserella flavalba]
MGTAPWLRLGAAAGGGIVLFVASPPRPLWWLAPVAFALLVLAVSGRPVRHAFGAGVAFGVTYLLPLLQWLDDFLGVAFGVWPWLGLVGLEALFFGLMGAGMAKVSRLPMAPVWMAAVVVAAEAVRSRVPYGGFPWGRVAFTQPEGIFLPLAVVGGAVLVGFAVALAGCGLGVVALRIRQTPRRSIAPGLIGVLPVLAGWLAASLIETGAEDGTMNVAVVQGNAPDSGLALLGRSATVRANHIAQANQLVDDVRAGRGPSPDLVILPESSNVFAPGRGDPDLDRIARELGVPVAVGGTAYSVDGRVSNRIILWSPGRGATKEYAKQQLVPFSEFVPLRAVAAAVTPFSDDPAGDMVPGDRPGVLDVGSARAGFAICYEVAYDYVLTDATRAGAQLLVVPTNNAWFGRTEMTFQQLAMARLRAVEHGRAVIVASTSGVSAIVRPDGSVVRRTGQFTSESMVEQVPLRSTTTVATRLGSTTEWAIVSLALVALMAAALRRQPVTSHSQGKQLW